MMKDIITKGTEISTADGCIVVKSSDGRTVSAESYYIDPDTGKRERLEDLIYTIDEIADLLKEMDGKNHKVEYKEVEEK